MTRHSVLFIFLFISIIYGALAYHDKVNYYYFSSKNDSKLKSNVNYVLGMSQSSINLERNSIIPRSRLKFLKLPTMYVGYGSIVGATSFALSKYIGSQLSLGYLGLVFVKYCYNAAQVFFQGGSYLCRSQGGKQAKFVSPRLHEIVQTIAKKSNIPYEIDTYIIPSKEVNAYATGISPKYSAIGVTSELLDVLTEDELQAVLAHECGHIVNKDCAFSTHYFVIISSFEIIQWFGREILRSIDQVLEFRKSKRQSEISNRDKSILFSMLNNTIHTDNDVARAKTFGYLMNIGGLILSVSSFVLRFAVSRTMEYAADYHASTICGSKSMINALQVISDKNKITERKQLNNLYSSLYIDNSASNTSKFVYFLQRKKSKNGFFRAIDWFMRLFETHPRVEDRIKRLQEYR